MTFICNTPHAMWGATTPSEFLASDCTLRLDLDADNSSGASGSDWQSPVICSGSVQSLADTDATWYSGYHTDSMRVRLMAPVPDAPLEYLSAVASGTVSIAGQGGTWMTLFSAGNTAVPVSNADFQAVVRSLEWHNDAVIQSPGMRTVEVVAYGPGGRRDTAYAYLEVPMLQSAGMDTTFSVCADGQPFGLFSPGGAAGGSWSPAGVFSPQSDLSGEFTYVLDNGVCPSDTAAVLVEVLPLPFFSLGQDTAVCTGEPLVLQAPGEALWQDGAHEATYQVMAPGLYWAEYTGLNGCAFRDSFTVIQKAPSQGQTSVQQCAGQSYTWNGEPFEADTNVCRTFPAANGCDSVHCLSLTFFYPALSLDTSICSGQTLSWLGGSYSGAGSYQDTVFYNGCLTAIDLTLAVGVPDTFYQTVRICAGEQYTAGMQTYFVSGRYVIPLLTPMGCDSTVILDLQVQPPAASDFSAGICPGSSYVFNGHELTQPGPYSALFSTPAGCDSTVTLNLFYLPAPAPQIVGDAFFCHGGMTTLDAGLFAAYQWSGGEPTALVRIASPGSYAVTVTNAQGCTAVDSVVVQELPPISAAWSIAGPLCHGGSDGFIELQSASGGVGPLIFGFNGGSGTSWGAVGNLAAGEQTVLVSDSMGCSVAYTFVLEEPASLAVDLGGSPVLDAGEHYTIPVEVNQAGMFSYFWSPPAGLDCITCPTPVVTASDSMVYTLLLTSEAGCTATGSITVLVRRETGIYIPQIFSPNGDGTNDFFAIYAAPGLVESISGFQIYDRWGELVFAGEHMAVNDEDSGWDGTLRGRPVLPGVYVWQAHIRLLDGAVVFKKGEVTVYR